MADVKTLDKVIDRPAVAAFRVITLVAEYEALDAGGNVLKSICFRADLERLSASARAEVEALAEESIKSANV